MNLPDVLVMIPAMPARPIAERLADFNGQLMTQETRTLFGYEVAREVQELQARGDGFDIVGVTWSAGPYDLSAWIGEREQLWRDCLAACGWDVDTSPIGMIRHIRPVMVAK